MAQLVKLQNYISRYEIEFNQYPNQFIRLKRTQWERMKQQWLMGNEKVEWTHEEGGEAKRPILLKKLFRKKSNEDEFEESEETIWELPENESTLMFEPNIVYQPTTLEELKRIFLDQLFHFQLKWASSTLLSKSMIDSKYYRDHFLRTILQKLPDHYFVFYQPIMKIKKTAIELDVLLLTPTECFCITVLEEEDFAVYIGSTERFWTKKIGEKDVKVLNPIIQLNRMETILSTIFRKHSIDLPIRKVLLSRNAYIDYPNSLYNIQFVDRRNYASWFNTLGQSTSPMKKIQVQAAEAIFKYVETISYSRDV